jgi:HAE1 family hydrophobic/amphiphilic exporter-1
LISTPVAVLGAFLALWSRHFENNVYVQIGLIMLIGLSAKNAILIVEYAKTEVEKGKSLTEAALIGARIRLRPILMTSFAFVFGCLPLWFATGSGGMSRQTLLGIFIIPVNFYVVEKLGIRYKKHPPASQRAGGKT